MQRSADVDDPIGPDISDAGQPSIDKLDRVFTVIATRIAGFAGQPAAFVAAVTIILLWSLTGPLFGYSDTWQLVVNTATTIVTFLMVFLIQNSQNRDAAAMQAKLDELIRAVDAARSQFIGIEHLTEREIDKVRMDLEREFGDHDGRRSPLVSLDHMKKRI